MTERMAYRVPEVCAMLGISRATLYRRVKTGEIAIHKLGSISLISRDVLERLLKAPHEATHDLARAWVRSTATD